MPKRTRLHEHNNLITELGHGTGLGRHHDLMSRIGLYTENTQLLGETEPLTLSNLSNFQVAMVGTEENLENQLHKTLQSRGTRILRVRRSQVFTDWF